MFDKPQRDALAMLLINFDRQGVLVSEIFWGLWLLPLGVLVYRSGFLPRFLGVWLFVNGLAYLAISATGLLSAAAPQDGLHDRHPRPLRRGGAHALAADRRCARAIP